MSTLTLENCFVVATPDNGTVTRDRALRRKQRAENFPVALRALPRQLRADLVAVYDVARVIDDLGDQVTGDRTALLTKFGADLATIWETGQPDHPVLRRLVPTVRVRALDHEPFERLVKANLADQRVDRYATYTQLRGTADCRQSRSGGSCLPCSGCPAQLRSSGRIGSVQRCS